MLAKSRELYEAFAFQVEVVGEPGMGAAFSKCGPLEVNIGVDSYREGGSAIPIKDPGVVDFPDLVLERGASSSSAFYDWAMTIANLAAGLENTGAENSGAVPPNFKRDLIIVQFDRQRRRVRTHTIVRAWPTKFRAGDWAGDRNDVVIESMTLSYDYFYTKMVRQPMPESWGGQNGWD